MGRAVPLKGLGNAGPSLASSSPGVAAPPSVPSACGSIAPLYVTVTWPSPWAPVRPDFPLLLRTPVVLDRGPSLMTSSYLDSTYKDPISK